MAEPVETITVEQTQVSCDGGGGALGHPRIYLHIKPEVGHIDCPYCGRRYVLDRATEAKAGGAKSAAGH
ncbi:MAG: zinc-finger domain-containing protein [Rhodospirillaceae bacterium]|nr:zinc-finger domain-containing protein [Rhodospirillaceae bacterium]